MYICTPTGQWLLLVQSVVFSFFPFFPFFPAFGSQKSIEGGTAMGLQHPPRTDSVLPSKAASNPLDPVPLAIMRSPADLFTKTRNSISLVYEYYYSSSSFCV